ncbi:iron uptake transporter deferrochelatase/peroxidase subunit [Sporolactobacillus sp. STSJ-5]|uniref:iron uptake transporter deferrochelatase/peroxidase subunit n=1 Tax=Sporolactobacillus sp. STSJ-5 TaxID=2965076 RepID=UPI0021077394|nr:iron uptake transporter deferrochelatase/peroxidase subunit [Sporolactobacillus sp. STSJ-5]MCQ2009826.1 iron uptake transporter deferrochelatase/peroxidase subunit [Sporolactobacillus sp. STSJ-5]
MDNDELGTPQQKKGYSRREMLKMTALAGGGIALGASGLGTALELLGGKTAAEPANQSKVPFFGAHQSGVATVHQSYGYLAAFDIDPSIHDVAKIMALFISWTRLAATLTQGKREINSSNKELPPNDTNEARDLGAANLTVTFGFGHSFFIKNGKDRFGLANQMPKQLTVMPKIAHETLDPSISNGDICVQVCADIQQVAFHALRNLIKEALGTANIRWMESGFLNGAKGKTPRNLFGFKDGTANVTDAVDQEKVIWAGNDEPKWMRGGTYLGYRKIKMIIETWDRDSYSDQENVFGRKKDSGAAFGRTHEKEPVIMSKQPVNSHVRLAHGTGKQIFRRAYSYTNGIQPTTGNLDAGLLFIAFQNKPQDSFIPMLRVLGKSDALNEYTDHVATGLFAIPAGIKKNEYFAQHLFE